MVYSLKDAAERNRLTGTTFIQLNFMVGLWALAGKCLYLAPFVLIVKPILTASTLQWV
jgi:hypothetical protein